MNTSKLSDHIIDMLETHQNNINSINKSLNCLIAENSPIIHGYLRKYTKCLHLIPTDIMQLIMIFCGTMRMTQSMCILLLPTFEKDTHQKQYTVHKLPLLYPTIGYPCIDMTKLHSTTNIKMYDSGFVSTSITYFDDTTGILLHRGYDIRDLCNNSDFIELSFLLLHGELPGKNDKLHHEILLKQQTQVNSKLLRFFQSFRYNTHPMTIMSSVIGILPSFYDHIRIDITNANRHNSLLYAYIIIGQIPTLAAMSYKSSIGEPICHPQNRFSFVENILYMMLSIPSKEYKISEIKLNMLNKFLILHADCEQDVSTTAVRLIASQYCNLFSCIITGIASLSGPVCNGHEAVLNMLQEIGIKENIPKFIRKAIDKRDPFRLIGFQICSNENRFNHRARMMQQMCHELWEELKTDDELDPLLELALKLEGIALNEEYFIRRRLFPGVDFYSTIILIALGIPQSMYSVMLVIAKITGWVSHWIQITQDVKFKRRRQSQLYVGRKARNIFGFQIKDKHEKNITKT
eukprot:327832_1